MEDLVALKLDWCITVQMEDILSFYEALNHIRPRTKVLAHESQYLYFISLHFEKISRNETRISEKNKSKASVQSRHKHGDGKPTTGVLSHRERHNQYQRIPGGGDTNSILPPSFPPARYVRAVLLDPEGNAVPFFFMVILFFTYLDLPMDESECLVALSLSMSIVRYSFTRTSISESLHLKYKYHVTERKTMNIKIESQHRISAGFL